MDADKAQHWDSLGHFFAAATEAMRRIMVDAARRRGRQERGGQLFAGTPAVWVEQVAAYGNDLERHRSLWTAENLRGAGFEVVDDGEPDRFGNQMLLAVSRL